MTSHQDLPMNNGSAHNSYDGNNEPGSSLSNSLATHRIRVIIVKAEGLYSKSFFKNPDPFVVLTVDGEQTKTSPVLKNTCDPYWGAFFDLHVRADSVITIQVFDQRRFKESSQGFLGVVNVLVSSVIDVSTIATTTLKYNLKPSTGKDKVKGSILVSLTTDFRGINTDNSQSHGGNVPAGSSSIFPSPAATASSGPAQGAGASSRLGTFANIPSTSFAHPSQQAAAGSATLSQVIQSKMQSDGGSERLPPNWSKQFDQQGRPYYIDHVNRRTQWEAPRAFASSSTSLLNAATTATNPNESNNADFTQQREQFERRNSAAPAQNDLPSGWERRLTPNGRYYYIDHTTQRTTWRHPNEIQRYRVVQPGDVEQIYQNTVSSLGNLPAGWEMRISPDGRPYYLDHGAKTSTWDDPRIPTIAGDDAPRYKVDFQKKLREFRMQPQLRLAEGETKMSISRNNIFNDSFTQFMKRQPLELKRKLTIEFANEPGLDYGGVSREFFFLLSHEIFNPIYGLFCYSSHSNYTLQINPHSSINPEHLHYFHFIGRVIGVAIYQRKYLDVYFVTAFYKMILEIPVTLEDMESIDAEVYKGLQWMQDNDVTDIGATFSAEDEMFGQVTVYDLREGGRDIDVTNENKAEYLDLIVKWRAADRVQEQITAIRTGIFEIVPRSLLSVFTDSQLEFLFCGVSDIDVEDWRKHTLYRNYSKDTDQVIAWFWKIVETEFDNIKRAQLLQFTTGTSRIPLNGFKDLQGSDGPRKFTIERCEDLSSFPKSHTCFNRIDLPPYPTYEMLLEKLVMAIECSEGFDEK